MSESVAPTPDDALRQLAQCLQRAGYRFITPTPATHQRVNARPGNQVASDLRGVFGWSRPFGTDVLPPDMLALMRGAGVLAHAPHGWRSTVRFSTLGDGLYAHSAFPTDTPEAVFFGPDTYRFVDAIERVLGDAPGEVRRAIDLGCGAGPGAITIARAFPRAEVYAADINDAALGITAVNARIAGAGNVIVRSSDLLAGVEGDFDLIVANPPYLVDRDERVYRHGGGALGTDLSMRIVESGVDRLAPGGTLLLYTGVPLVDGEDAFLAATAAALRGGPVQWRYRELDPDVFGEELDNPAYARAERIAAVELVARRQ
jgi:SAM-dependent methyltransferase